MSQNKGKVDKLSGYRRIETACDPVSEKVMPISLYPNATVDKTEKIYDVLQKELGNYPPNSAIADEMELRIHAALCQAFENIFLSQSIRAQHTFSPKAVQEITSLIRSCK